MDTSLQKLVSDLEKFSEENDQRTNERSKRMLNITHDTGQFLSVLIRATNAQRILEIGTSNGYSTIWLADASAAIGGEVATFEISKYKYKFMATLATYFQNQRTMYMT